MCVALYPNRPQSRFLHPRSRIANPHSRHVLDARQPDRRSRHPGVSFRGRTHVVQEYTIPAFTISPAALTCTRPGHRALDAGLELARHRHCARRRVAHAPHRVHRLQHLRHRRREDGDGRWDDVDAASWGEFFPYLYLFTILFLSTPCSVIF
jgi:hypothetical protein